MVFSPRTHPLHGKFICHYCNEDWEYRLLCPPKEKSNFKKSDTFLTRLKTKFSAPSKACNGHRPKPKRREEKEKESDLEIGALMEGPGLGGPTK